MSFEGEIGYLWLDITIDDKDVLVGGHSYVDESRALKLIKSVKTDQGLYYALTKIVAEYLFSEDSATMLPSVSPYDDIWVVEQDDQDSEDTPLSLSQVKRAFYEYIECEEVGMFSYNFATGKTNDDGDMKEHPQETLHGNYAGWLMEYCDD